MINRYGIALATSYHLITASHEFRMRGDAFKVIEITSILQIVEITSAFKSHRNYQCGKRFITKYQHIPWNFIS